MSCCARSIYSSRHHTFVRVRICVKILAHMHETAHNNAHTLVHTHTSKHIHISTHIHTSPYIPTHTPAHPHTLQHQHIQINRELRVNAVSIWTHAQMHYGFSARTRCCVAVQWSGSARLPSLTLFRCLCILNWSLLYSRAAAAEPLHVFLDH